MCMYDMCSSHHHRTSYRHTIPRVIAILEEQDLVLTYPAVVFLPSSSSSSSVSVNVITSMQRFIRYCCCHVHKADVRSSSGVRGTIIIQNHSSYLHQHQHKLLPLHILAINVRRRCCYTTLIFSNILPNISASAACVRTKSIIDGLLTSGWKDDIHIDDDKTIVKEGHDNDDGYSHTHKVYYVTSAATPVATTPANTGHNNNDSDDGTKSTDDRFHILHLPPNRTDLFQETFTALNNKHQQRRRSPDLVIFDRFYMEETYSFQIRRHYESIPLVLDMQDFHSLRHGRQTIVTKWDHDHDNKNRIHHHSKHNANVNNDDDHRYDPFGCLDDVLQYYPSIDGIDVGDGVIKDDRLLRELASIHRCDLTLVCSPYEMELLQTTYGIPEEKLCLASFFVQNNVEGDHNEWLTDGVLPTTMTTDDGNNIDGNKPTIEFVFCGGFKHAPNVDAVNVLVNHIWPSLRREMSDLATTLHIYGAFCPPTFQAQYNKHSITTGMYVHGYTENLSDVFVGHPSLGIQRGSRKSSSADDTLSPQIPTRRILLAPIRFGAGIKGKIIDAWTFGVPVVTTPIGSEGMTVESSSSSSDPLFGGRIAKTIDDFCQSAIDLARDPHAYGTAQRDGDFLLRTLFDSKRNWKEVQRRLQSLLQDERSNTNINLMDRRKRDYSRALLWHQTARSTEYFSRWIELKEAVKRDRGE